jgi:hypothetical protein
VLVTFIVLLTGCGPREETHWHYLQTGVSKNAEFVRRPSVAFPTEIVCEAERERVARDPVYSKTLEPGPRCIRTAVSLGL